MPRKPKARKRRCEGINFAGEPCKNKIAAGRYCSTCRYRKWVVGHPLEYYFKNLKNRARQRGKIFTLTLDEWRRFESETDFMRQRAESEETLSIDRIEENGPYSFTNICIKPLLLNWQKWKAWKAGQPTPKDEPTDNPF